MSLSGEINPDEKEMAGAQRTHIDALSGIHAALSRKKRAETELRW